MKKYNYKIINNSLGWLCFIVAAVTYLLTLEPTASFWDCPEFIAQGAKLEVGHPPGNPIFMLAARFFVNFTGGNMAHAAIAVNTMSALLSAGTILLLFWSITHLTRILIAGRGNSFLTLPQLIAVMGSGLCGALVYTWSDTFWFSAVEGEVYAFSSFCTALVFWLILKWENRADEPHSDRYLILIAYVIGVSIAVHLLNLLCIPAIALVIYYRKWTAPSLRGSLLTICISAALIVLILYGLVPGFIGVAGKFEVFCVNKLHMSYNLGVLIYAVALVGVMIWCIRSLYAQRSVNQIRWSFLLTVVLSGIPFIGSGFVIPVLVVAALAIYLFVAKKLPVRILTIAATSILVIFIGYSSYALLLIRSNANPPMNQNAPDNVFDLASYLSREQYGETPLLFGQSFASSRKYVPSADGRSFVSDVSYGAPTYQKDPDNEGHYIKKEGQMKPKYVPEMLFPRMHSSAPSHPAEYLKWIDAASISDLPTVEEYVVYDRDGKPDERYAKQPVHKPSFGQNLKFFLNYQFGHMYWRYFMWNFAGRQNDLQGQGELNRGNWISGIPFIDNPRLGDQSLLPPDQGKDNPGHNVFYMLPLLMGIIGLTWQALAGERGIEQFWVVFMLFFMTGIAIVLYLNQPPLQVRERDYAFAGSFYAFSIWVGMGVAALWRFVVMLRRKTRNESDEVASSGRPALIGAVVAAVIGIIVPLQMVSQTWDDHDRSGRYTARDYGMNYLSSLDENAIIFTNGDNDTFPLWYAQEVEGYRTDVRVVNLSYLTTPWYANQLRIPSYDAPAITMQATPADYELDRLAIRYFDTENNQQLMPASRVLGYAYAHPGVNNLLSTLVSIPSNMDAAVRNGVVKAGEESNGRDSIVTDIFVNKNMPAVYQNGLLALDFINTSAMNGWDRPVYFAMTVPDEYYLGLDRYLRNTGLTYQVTPVDDNDSLDANISVNTDKMYRNVTERFRWGGLDNLPADETVYLDETVRRMVSTHRLALYDLAAGLYNEGLDAETAGDSIRAAERFEKALEILDIMTDKLPARLAPYAVQMGERIGRLYCAVAQALDDEAAAGKGLAIMYDELKRYARYLPYYKSLIEHQGGKLTGNRYNLSIYQLPVSGQDMYVPYALSTLLQSYYDCGGDVEAIDAELKKENINILKDIELVMGYDPFSPEHD